jgi:hypothetical protein
VYVQRVHRVLWSGPAHVFLLPFLFFSHLSRVMSPWRWVRICTAGSNSCSRLVLLLVCVVLLVATAAAAAVPRLCPRFKAVTFPLSLSLALPPALASSITTPQPQTLATTRRSRWRSCCGQASVVARSLSSGLSPARALASDRWEAPREAA